MVWLCALEAGTVCSRFGPKQSTLQKKKSEPKRKRKEEEREGLVVMVGVGRKSNFILGFVVLL